MLGSAPRRSSGLLLATVALTLVACERPTDPPIDPEPGRLAVSANVTAMNIETMVVTVTGPGIDKALVFNMEIKTETDGRKVASGTILIPAGSDRKLELDAYDLNQIKTHHGEKTISAVKPGSDNGSLSVVLLPIAGGQPVTAEFGIYVVTITPASWTPIVGGQQTFTATVKDNKGNPITIDSAKLKWATADPSVFSIDGSGLAKALKLGSGTVVATYEGFAGTASVTVQ
jgi:hypothetical protein